MSLRAGSAVASSAALALIRCLATLKSECMSFDNAILIRQIGMKKSTHQSSAKLIPDVGRDIFYTYVRGSVDGR